MLDQRSAGFMSKPRDDIENAVGQPGFLDERCEFKRACRCEFRRLDDDTAAGCQRGRAFHRNKPQWGIPGCQRCNDANRLADRECQSVRFLDRNRSSLYLVGQTAIVIPTLGHAVQLAANLSYKFPIIP